MARLPRASRDGTISATAIMIAVTLATLAVTVPARLVHDMGTLGDLFSILALPIMLAVFYTAQRLHLKARESRISLLKEKDKSSRKHMEDTVSLCLSTVMVIIKSKEPSLAVGNTLMMRQIVDDIGLARAQHGHVLDRTGQFLAERARTSALKVFEDGSVCSHTALPDLHDDLLELKGSMWGVDDKELVNRREHEAGFESPAI